MRLEPCPCRSNYQAATRHCRILPAIATDHPRIKALTPVSPQGSIAQSRSRCICSGLTSLPSQANVPMRGYPAIYSLLSASLSYPPKESFLGAAILKLRRRSHASESLALQTLRHDHRPWRRQPLSTGGVLVQAIAAPIAPCCMQNHIMANQPALWIKEPL